MMTLWCIFCSPLMLGAELTKLDGWPLSLLTNKEVLELLSEGYYGVQVRRDNDCAMWVSYNDRKHRIYAALFSLKEEKVTVGMTMEELEAAISESAFSCLEQKYSGKG